MKKTFLYCLMLSLLVHLSLMGSMHIDWNLKEQIQGLMQVVQQTVDKLKEAAKESPVKLVETATNEVVSNIEETVDSLKKGKKLRFGPDHESWKKLDEQIALEEAKKKEEQKQKDKVKGLTNLNFNRFISPPIEVSLVEEKPKPVPSIETTTGPSEVIIQKVDFQPECDQPGFKNYGGIGLQFAPVISKDQILKGQTPTQHEISVVPPGYPAAKAGIQKGDIIEGNPLRFKGQIGTMVEVPVLRNGKLLTFNLKRVKVCYEEKIEKKPPIPNLKKDLINK